MRRKQFAQLVTALRAELERSTDPAAGVAGLPTLKQVIARNYEAAYQDYDWPHLNTIFDKIPLNAGQRYYDFPEGCDFDDLEEIVVWWNAQPVPIERGIGFEDYATYDSEEGATSDPVIKWDVRATDTHEQMEVWPVPASNQQSIQIRGQRKFEPLINDEDLCRIDDQIVVLASAVELLPAKARTSVQAKLAAAQSRLARVKGRSKAASPSVRMGLGRSSQPVYGKSVVRVAGR
jgi:hypothetical protein